MGGNQIKKLNFELYIKLIKTKFHKNKMKLSSLFRTQTKTIPTVKTTNFKTPGSCLERPQNFKPADNYAIIEIGGVQKIIEEDRYYACNQLPAEIGSKIRFGRVLAVKTKGKLYLGTPWLENASIIGEILNAHLGDKIVVYKIKPKKHYRSKNGHRQHLTRFLVTRIA